MNRTPSGCPGIRMCRLTVCCFVFSALPTSSWRADGTSASMATLRCAAWPKQERLTNRALAQAINSMQRALGQKSQALGDWRMHLRTYACHLHMHVI
jgi:hypothetical protein